MNRVVHFEIPVNDPDRISKFFGDVFGWQFKNWGGPMDYWIISTGGGSGIDGGMMRRQHSDQPMVNTIEVENVDAAISKIEGAGGTIVVAKMPIPGVGYLAYFKDPEGNIFGVMHSDKTAA